MLHFCSRFLNCKMTNPKPLAEGYRESQKHRISAQGLPHILYSNWINSHRGSTMGLHFTKLETEAQSADVTGRIHSWPALL